MKKPSEKQVNLLESMGIRVPRTWHYYIDEYDGIESVHEEHNSWS